MGTTTRTRRTLVALIAVAAAGLTAAVPAEAGTGASQGGSRAAGYNAVPSSVNGNVASIGFEATQTYEFGDEVTLDRAGKAQTMTVLMSSWGCQSGSWSTADCTTAKGATFDVPLTFSIYSDVDGAAGQLLVTQTTTVAMPYRPSASSVCQGPDLGKWFNTADKTCYNGYPQAVTMKLAGQALPKNVIWTVEYNTTTAGRDPIGVKPCTSSTGGCGYDSLNVGANSFPGAPFAGVDNDEDVAYRNGSLETGWTGYRPLGTITVG